MGLVLTRTILTSRMALFKFSYSSYLVLQSQREPAYTVKKYGKIIQLLLCIGYSVIALYNQGEYRTGVEAPLFSF